MTIYEKLLEVQVRLNAPKNQYNGFGNYYYRSCEDIVEAVKPLLKEVGLLLVFSDEIVYLGDRFYINASAAVIDVETGERLAVTAQARESAEKKKFDEAQLTGAASSYARKYALNGLFAIDDNKDADTQPPPEKNETPKKPEKKKSGLSDSELTTKEKKHLWAKAKEAGLDGDGLIEFMKRVHTTKLEDYKTADKDFIISELDKKIKEMEEK